jgi:F0F1-type ATP synthase assembly protein I
MSARNEIWFARRFPVGHPRNAMAPVHWKGFAMFGVFVATMLVGALGFVLSAMNREWMWGVIVFGALSAMGAGMLLIAVQMHGDTTRTVDEHRKARANA